MARVALDGVTKIYPGGVKAVDRVDLEIADETFVVLVGPSGCGKSTTLRMIAGLEDITSGRITIGDRVVNDVSPKDRDIAMVFQNYALYPHMTVRQNMAFSLKLRRRELGLSRADIEKKVLETARVLGIEELLARRPKALSGGQRQRVAVGRAIVRSPKAFLFDEPLSNLDAKLRVEMRSEIKRLQRRLRTTTVYVTHDQEEAMTLGDNVVVMKDGRIHQCGSAMEVYERPVNRFVAGFIGTPPMNFLDGKIVQDDGALAFDEGSALIRLPTAVADRVRAYCDRPMIMGIRPDAFSVEAPATDGGRPCKKCDSAMVGRFCHQCGTEQEGAEPGYTAPGLGVKIALIEPLGDDKDLYMTTEAHNKLVGRVDARARVAEGQSLRMFVDMRGVHLFEPGEAGVNVTASRDGVRSSAN